MVGRCGTVVLVVLGLMKLGMAVIQSLKEKK